MDMQLRFSCLRIQSDNAGECFAEEDMRNYKEGNNNGLCNEKLNDLILIIKPARCTNFSNLFLE